MKRTLVLAATLVAAALVVASIVAYVVTGPPGRIPLQVTDGSTVGAISGNLTDIPSPYPLFLDFTAMTYANETKGVTSTLTLRLHTWTFYNGGCGCVEININATAVGVFASDLHPANLELSANQTGANGTLDTWPSEQSGTNVSFDPGQSFGFYNGSGVLSAAIRGGSGPAYRFSYSDRFEVWGRPQYNRFVGFRATVTGPFAVPVSVGILLKIINTNGGTWV